MPRSKSGKKNKGKTARYFFYLVTIAIVAMVPLLLELYMQGVITSAALGADLDISLSMFFSFVVFSYLLAKGQKLKIIIKGLGLTRDRLNRKNLLIGVLLFLLILITEFGIEAFSMVTGIQLPTNVSVVLAGMPLYFLIFTFLIAPINEEILFRGFLVPRFGIVVSALLFAAPHFLSYASVSEFFAAFVFGLLAGYVFKRYRSLYSTILAHALVNLLTIATFVILLHV